MKYIVVITNYNRNRPEGNETFEVIDSKTFDVKEEADELQAEMADDNRSCIYEVFAVLKR